MPESACLEIHMINVSHGDSVMIINRDLDKVKAAINAIKPKLKDVPKDPIDWVPYAIEKSNELAKLKKPEIDLVGTVKYCLLIDGGEDFMGDDVVFKLEKHGVVDKAKAGQVVDGFSLMVSHFHRDHMAGLRQVLVAEDGPRPKKGTQKYKGRYLPERIYCSPLHHPRNPRNEDFPLFAAAVNVAVAAGSELVEVGEGGIELAKPSVKKDKSAPVLLAVKSVSKTPVAFDLGTGVDGIPITVTMLAAGAAVYDGSAKTITPVPSKVKVKSKLDNKVLWDENDRSLVFYLEYGSFRYFHGGDIAGDGGTDGGNETKGIKIKPTGKKAALNASFTHGDVEKYLFPAMADRMKAQPAYKKGQDWFPNAGHCTVIKASHHASSSSVDTYFLATARPRIVLMSTGIRRKHHGHPTPEVMFRCDPQNNPKWLLPGGKGAKTDNTVKAIYVTEVTDKNQGKTFTMAVTQDTRLLGDIVLRPVDSSIVNVRAAKAKTPLKVQVYGTGDRSDLSKVPKMAKSSLRPCAPFNSKPVPYRIGPFVTDIT